MWIICLVATALGFVQIPPPTIDVTGNVIVTAAPLVATGKVVSGFIHCDCVVGNVEIARMVFSPLRGDAAGAEFTCAAAGSRITLKLTQATTTGPIAWSVTATSAGGSATKSGSF